jgi:hypothetical protein
VLIAFILPMIADEVGMRNLALARHGSTVSVVAAMCAGDRLYAYPDRDS